jgi:hypothetical protein
MKGFGSWIEEGGPSQRLLGALVPKNKLTKAPGSLHEKEEIS